MKLSDFLKETLNKWVKIESDDFMIIQNITSFEPTKSPTMFKCVGKSVSKCEGDVLELDDFYMSKTHLDGTVNEISEEDAQKYIQSMKEV